MVKERTCSKTTNLTTIVPERNNLMVVGSNKIGSFTKKEEIDNGIIKSPDPHPILSTRK